MRIWETKCHVWIDTKTNRVRTLYKHTFQRDAHANKYWSTEENLLFPSLLHFPFFISPTLHPPSLHMCETCCRGNGLQRCVFIRGGEASFSLSFASRLLKQNKASWRKRTWEWKKWKLIIFLHILERFTSLFICTSCFNFLLSQVMTRFSLSHFDNKHQDEGESLIHSKTCERTHSSY